MALQRRGLPVNRKRLMRVIGIEAAGPKPRLSRPHPADRVYTYLLRDVAIERVDQVWSTRKLEARLSRRHRSSISEQVGSPNHAHERSEGSCNLS